MGSRRKKSSRWKQGNIDIVDTKAIPPEFAIQPLWSEAVINSGASKFWEVSPESRSVIQTKFCDNWDAFGDRLWYALLDLVGDAEKTLIYNKYMESMADEAWQKTNDCWTNAPSSVIVELDIVDHLWDRLIGTKRTHHVWHSQLAWTCKFLDLAMI